MRHTIELARAAGCNGICVWRQGPGQYLAACLNKAGQMDEPRNWNTHPTPEAAVADLGKLLEERQRVATKGYAPTVDEALRHPDAFVDGMEEV